MNDNPQQITQQENTGDPNLALLTKFSNTRSMLKIGFSIEEALGSAHNANAVIASNKRLNHALRIGSNEWKSIESLSKSMIGLEGWKGMDKAFLCWTGTMTAYARPNKKLGKTIEYTNPNTGNLYRFLVPEAYRKEKNAILIAEHPDYTLEIDGRTRNIHAEQVEIVHRFPSLSGWYLEEQIHGIPIGNQIDASNPDAKYLYRIDQRVGPVGRCYVYSNHDSARTVFLMGRPSQGCGVFLEASGNNAQLNIAPSPDKGNIVMGVLLSEVGTLAKEAGITLQEVLDITESDRREAIIKRLQEINSHS